MQRILEFKDIDLNGRSAFEFLGLKVTNRALVLYNQYQGPEQEKNQTFFYFMLALRNFLIPSISNDLLCKEWETITHNKDGKNMGVHCCARELDNMQSKLLDQNGCISITDEVKISKFRNNIPDIIRHSITLHLFDDMT